MNADLKQRLANLRAAIAQRFRSMLPAVRDRLRAAPLALVFLVTFVAVLALAPQKAGLGLWGLSKLALGGYVGYWCDRLCFRGDSRPHLLTGIARGAAEKRRALIVAASIVAAALIP